MPGAVEDLLQSLGFLGRLGQARGGLPPGKTPAAGGDGAVELVYYSLLFSTAVRVDEGRTSISQSALSFVVSHRDSLCKTVG